MGVEEAGQQRDVAEILDRGTGECVANAIPATDGAQAFPGNNDRAVGEGGLAHRQDDAAAEDC
jgi:hypothetical protein